MTTQFLPFAIENRRPSNYGYFEQFHIKNNDLWHNNTIKITWDPNWSKQYNAIVLMVLLICAICLFYAHHVVAWFNGRLHKWSLWQAGLIWSPILWFASQPSRPPWSFLYGSSKMLLHPCDHLRCIIGRVCVVGRYHTLQRFDPSEICWHQFLSLIPIPIYVEFKFSPPILQVDD